MNYMFGNEECSSGCESGWTLYLEQSSICRGNDSPDDHRLFTDVKRSNEEDEDEDEDLSMVSDASSGPPHLHEEEEEEGYGGIGNDKNGCFYNYATHEQVPLSSRNKLIKRNKIIRENNRCRNKPQDHSSLLDDTASSSCNKTRSQPSSVENVLEYSQGYSTTQFQVRPPYQEHFDFFHSENQRQQQNQWFEGKRW